MKKFVCYLLVAVMLVASLATTAFAAEPGAEVKVDFVVNGNPGFTSVILNFDYDESALTLVNVEQGKAPGMFDANLEKAKVILVNGGSNTTGDVVVFTATFKVADTADGTYGFTVNVAEAYNQDNEPVKLNITAAPVVVEGIHVHAYTESIKMPTCTEKGLKTFTCACGDSYTEEIPALGHDMGKWTNIDNPNYHQRYCQRVCDGVKCDHKENESHDFVKTETETKITYTCSVCGYTMEEGIDPVPPTGDVTPVIVTSVVAVIAMITLAGYMLKRKFAL